MSSTFIQWAIAPKSNENVTLTVVYVILCKFHKILLQEHVICNCMLLYYKIGHHFNIMVCFLHFYTLHNIVRIKTERFHTFCVLAWRTNCHCSKFSWEKMALMNCLSCFQSTVSPNTLLFH